VGESDLKIVDATRPRNISRPATCAPVYASVKNSAERFAIRGSLLGKKRAKTAHRHASFSVTRQLLSQRLHSVLIGRRASQSSSVTGFSFANYLEESAHARSLSLPLSLSLSLSHSLSLSLSSPLYLPFKVKVIDDLNVKECKEAAKLAADSC